MTIAIIGIILIFLMIIGYMVYKVWIEKPEIKKADKPKPILKPKTTEKKEYKVILAFDVNNVIEVSDILSKFFSKKHQEITDKGTISVNADKENEFILIADNKELQEMAFNFFSNEASSIAIIKKVL